MDITYTLYLDTSGKLASVALFRNFKPVCFREHSDMNTQSGFIHQAIEDLLEEARLGWHHIQSVVVNNGPGSYTGLRLGLAVAKGLCFALSCKLFVINKLELGLRILRSRGVEGSLIFCIRAREGESFAMAVEAQDENLLGPSVYNDEIINDLSIKKNIPIYSYSGELSPDLRLMKSISISLEEIGVQLELTGQRDQPVELSSIEPFYLKSVFLKK